MLPRKPVRLDPRIAWFQDVRCLLSPMSGVTDRPFREVCRDFGADMGFCEFTSASGLYYENESTWKLIDTEGEQGRVGIQIFGSDPEHMAAAARLLLRAPDGRAGHQLRLSGEEGGAQVRGQRAAGRRAAARADRARRGRGRGAGARVGQVPHRLGRGVA